MATKPTPKSTSFGFNGTSGADLAAQLGPEEAEAARAIKLMLQQLLIALVKRNGGRIQIPVAEVDDTGQDLLLMSVHPDGKDFIFMTSKKN